MQTHVPASNQIARLAAAALCQLQCLLRGRRIHQGSRVNMVEQTCVDLCRPINCMPHPRNPFNTFQEDDVEENLSCRLSCCRCCLRSNRKDTLRRAFLAETLDGSPGVRRRDVLLVKWQNTWPLKLGNFQLQLNGVLWRYSSAEVAAQRCCLAGVSCKVALRGLHCSEGPAASAEAGSPSWLASLETTS